jgi:Flp pilus assembly protein TadD
MAEQVCLKKSPADVNALYYEALCCYQLNDVAGARLRYQRIIQVAPDNPAANLARTALSTWMRAANLSRRLPL